MPDFTLEAVIRPKSPPTTPDEKLTLKTYIEHNLEPGHIIVGNAQAGTAQQVPYNPAGNRYPIIINLNLVEISGVWTQTVTHNIGYFPIVTVMDNDNNVVEVAIKHISTNEYKVMSLVDFDGTMNVL